MTKLTRAEKIERVAQICLERGWWTEEMAAKWRATANNPLIATADDLLWAVDFAERCAREREQGNG